MTKDEIKSIRSKSGLTQREFGEAIGVSVRTVESWEAGHRKVSHIAEVAVVRMFTYNVEDRICEKCKSFGGKRDVFINGKKEECNICIKWGHEMWGSFKGCPHYIPSIYHKPKHG